MPMRTTSPPAWQDLGGLTEALSPFVGLWAPCWPFPLSVVNFCPPHPDSRTAEDPEQEACGEGVPSARRRGLPGRLLARGGAVAVAPQVNQISGASQVVRQGPREGPLPTAPDTGLDLSVSRGSPAFLQRDPSHLAWLSPGPLGPLHLWTRPSGPQGHLGSTAGTACGQGEQAVGPGLPSRPETGAPRGARSVS